MPKHAEKQKRVRHDLNKIDLLCVRQKQLVQKNLYYVFNFAFRSLPDLVQYHYRRQETVAEEGVYLKKPTYKAEWQFNHEQIELSKKLGSGNFGEVFMGFLQKDPFNKPITVAIKKLHLTDLDIIGKMKFLREADLMLSLKHYRQKRHIPFEEILNLTCKKLFSPNIVTMYGVATAVDPIMVIMEMCDHSILHRIEEHFKNIRPIYEVERVNLIYGAAKGLAYLHSFNIIHRDIAARNCLIINGEAKISDFGLSCIGEHKEKKMKNVPIRYMAPETLKKGHYSLKSDVYTFGIFIWEVYSYCRQPYDDIEDNKVARKVIMEQKQVLKTVETAPAEIEELMYVAMSLKPDDRPAFADIVDYLANSVPGVIVRRKELYGLKKYWLPLCIDLFERVSAAYEKFKKILAHEFR